MKIRFSLTTILLIAGFATYSEIAFAKGPKDSPGPVNEDFENADFAQGLKEWDLKDGKYFSIGDDMPAGVEGESIKYSKNDTNTDVFPAFSQAIRVKKDTYFRIEFYYKGDGRLAPIFNAIELNAKSRKLIRLKRSSGWEKCSVELAYHPGITNYRMQINPTGALHKTMRDRIDPEYTGNGTVFFTGFSITEVTKEEPPVPVGPYDFKTTEIVYKNTDTIPLVLYVDVPQGVPGPHPVWIIIHGGGFVGGHPSGKIRDAEPLASRGIACVRIQYRLIKHGGTFPKTIGDVMDSIEWVRKNADKYNFDLTRVGLTGGSAGAVLSSVAAQRTPECTIYAGNCGLYDAWNLGYSRFGGRGMIGHSEDQIKDASAIRQIKNPPPATILFHGGADATINVDQAIRFAEALRKEGARVETHIYPDGGHNMLNDYDRTKKLIEFINREWKMHMAFSKPRRGASK